MSERIPWPVPVPSHHTTRQGGRGPRGEGRMTKCEKSGEKGKRDEEARVGGVRGKQEIQVGGTGYVTFLLAMSYKQ